MHRIEKEREDLTEKAQITQKIIAETWKQLSETEKPYVRRMKKKITEVKRNISKYLQNHLFNLGSII